MTLCLVELIDLLMNGNNYFYPNHPDFQYQRIGIKKVPKEEYPTFIPDNVAVTFEDLTWHQSRMNLSLLCKIPGTVVNNNIEEKTFVYRNFTLIRDGQLHINLLPCQLDATIYNLLTSHYPKVIINVTTYVSVLDFSQLPLISDRICPKNPTAEALATKVIRKLQLECHMKVLKYYRENNKKDNIYSPPTKTTKEEHKFYMAKEFQIKIVGCSQIPKVSDLNKKITIPAQFMKEIKPTLVNDALFDLTKNELKTVNSEIQRYKLYMVLCNQWFEDLTDNTYIFNGNVGNVKFVNTKITFKISDVKVEYD